MSHPVLTKIEKTYDVRRAQRAATNPQLQQEVYEEINQQPPRLIATIVQSAIRNQLGRITS